MENKERELQQYLANLKIFRAVVQTNEMDEDILEHCTAYV